LLPRAYHGESDERREDEGERHGQARSQDRVAVLGQPDDAGALIHAGADLRVRHAPSDGGDERDPREPDGENDPAHVGCS
jgi:hypothetical protein